MSDREASKTSREALSGGLVRLEIHASSNGSHAPKLPRGDATLQRAERGVKPRAAEPRARRLASTWKLGHPVHVEKKATCTKCPRALDRVGALCKQCHAAYMRAHRATRAAELAEVKARLAEYEAAK